MKPVNMNTLTQVQIDTLIKENSTVPHPKMPAELYLGILLSMISLIFIFITWMGYQEPNFTLWFAILLIVVPGGFGIRCLYLYRKRLPAIKQCWKDAQEQLDLLKKEVKTRHEFYLSHQKG